MSTSSLQLISLSCPPHIALAVDLSVLRKEIERNIYGVNSVDQDRMMKCVKS